MLKRVLAFRFQVAFRVRVGSVFGISNVLEGEPECMCIYVDGGFQIVDLSEASLGDLLVMLPTRIYLRSVSHIFIVNLYCTI